MLCIPVPILTYPSSLSRGSIGSRLTLPAVRSAYLLTLAHYLSPFHLYDVRSTTGDRDPHKISNLGFGIPWKTKCWMSGGYNTNNVSPALDAPTYAT